MREYFNLLAAAETGQGHHSLHETLFTLCNDDFYLPSLDKEWKDLDEKVRAARKKKVWEYINYKTSYEEFLSSAFKETPAYQTLCHKYPQFLDPARHQVATAQEMLYPKRTEIHAMNVQRKYRARLAYRKLNDGTFWHLSNQIKDESSLLSEQ